MSVRDAVRAGQIWRHVGDEDLPGTGLLVRIREIHGDHFFADYPPDSSARRYYGWTLGRYYEPMSPAEARKQLLG